MILECFFGFEDAGVKNLFIVLQYWLWLVSM